MQTAILNALVLLGIVATGYHITVIGNRIEPWERGKKSVPCYYWKIIQLDGETRFAYMLRVTKRELIDQEPKWLEIREGKLLISGKQLQPMPNQVRIVFAENDEKPQLVEFEMGIAKEMLALRGAVYSAGSTLPKTIEKSCKDVEQFWLKIVSRAKESVKKVVAEPNKAK